MFNLWTYYHISHNIQKTCRKRKCRIISSAIYEPFAKLALLQNDKKTAIHLSISELYKSTWISKAFDL